MAQSSRIFKMSSKRIREIREKSDLTQAFMGRLLRCSSKTVQRLEKDQAEPEPDQIDMLLLVEAYFIDNPGRVKRVKHILETAGRDQILKLFFS